MWPTSQLIGLTLLWWNWILCISGIFGHCAPNGSQSGLEPIRHVGPGRSRISYSSRELKAIRTSLPRTRIPTAVWECIISLGIRKPNRSKRAGHRTKCRNRSEADSIKRGPWNVKNSNQSNEAQQGQQDVSSSASIPSVIYANIRSVTSKIDELQAVVSINNPYIVCLTETWLNSNIPNSACDLTDFTCYRNDRQSAMAVGSTCTSGLFILVSGYRILKTEKLNQFGSRFGRIVFREALHPYWLLLYNILQAVLLSRILC